MTKEDLEKHISELSVEEKKLRNLYLRDLSNGTLQGPLTGYASIDKPWLKYYSKENLLVDIPKVSPYDLLEKTAKSIPENVALTYMPKKDFEINISFNSLLKDINKIASSIVGLGINKNDIILAILPNFPEAKELLFATLKLGIPIYPFNPLLPTTVLDETIKKYNIKNIFLFDGFIEKYDSTIKNNLSQIDNIIHLDGTEALPSYIRRIIKLKKTLSGNNGKKYSKSMDYFEFLKYQSKEHKYDFDYSYDEDKVILIEGTSGTTGIPKGVGLTGKNMNTSITQQLNGGIENNVGDKYLDIMNNSLAYGATACVVSMIGGLRTYFSPGFTMDLYDLVKEKNIDLVVAGPVHCENLKQHILNGEEKIYIKNWISGGAPLNNNTLELINGSQNYDDESIAIRQGYGATENEGAITYQVKGSYKFGSVGIPFSKENVGIFNPDTLDELGYEMPGEIAVSGPSIMKEYLFNKDETNKVMKVHKDGSTWLHMKDIGYIDQDGCLFFVDRIKNIFGRNGINVHPKAIDSKLLELNNIKNCFTTGVEHPQEQMVPVTFIQLDNPDVDLEIQKNIIYEYCYQNMEESSIPYEIIFVENIPINAGGKVDINYLLESTNVNYMNNNGERKRILSVENVNLVKF